MTIVWIALIVVAFFIGKYGGEPVFNAISKAIKWLWNKIV